MSAAEMQSSVTAWLRQRSFAFARSPQRNVVTPKPERLEIARPNADLGLGNSTPPTYLGFAQPRSIIL